jgi:CheY-like chemotaxis protein
VVRACWPIEATRQIRQRERAGDRPRHVPIIALTAATQDEDRQRCAEAGMDDFLARPIEPPQLRAALARWR